MVEMTQCDNDNYLLGTVKVQRKQWLFHLGVGRQVRDGFTGGG